MTENKLAKRDFKVKYNDYGQIIFSELDIDAIKDYYGFTTINQLGSQIYLSNGIDEFYIEYKGKLMNLWHKNAIKNTKGYHKEQWKFSNIEDVMTYCKRHVSKFNGLNTKAAYRSSRMDMLFAQISK